MKQLLFKHILHLVQMDQMLHTHWKVLAFETMQKECTLKN